MRKFKMFDEYHKQTEGQDFGEPTINKNGQKINVHDWINAGREDTEIYPTLEKYGTIQKMQINTEQLYGDVRNIREARDIFEIVNNSENLWKSLPIELREKFEHNKSKFLKEGEQYLKNIIDKEKIKENSTNNEIEIKEKENVQK